jgi:DNA-binding NtrC family response regulator
MRVLLIDDDARIRGWLAGLLAEQGHDVETADGAEIGLVAFCRAAIDGAPFEAVVTDLRRPTLDGTKVLDRILAIAPQTITVLVNHPLCASELRRALGLGGQARVACATSASTSA